MKKTYQFPTTRVVKIKINSLLVGASASVTFTQEGGSAPLNEGTASGAALGRRHSSLWDDDE
jgi:hypothetical protein